MSILFIVFLVLYVLPFIFLATLGIAMHNIVFKNDKICSRSDYLGVFLTSALPMYNIISSIIMIYKTGEHYGSIFCEYINNSTWWGKPMFKQKK